MERFNVTLLGRTIGTASGGDMHDSMVYGYYDFEPAKGVALPAGQCDVNVETGLFSNLGEDGMVLTSVDLLQAIASVPSQVHEIKE
jgi:hypothetical protein